MANSPITGNADLDAYLYDLQLQIGEAANTGTLAANNTTGEIYLPATNVVVGYIRKYIHIKYGDDYNGNGFSSSPLNKNYYGIRNSDYLLGSNNPAEYTWKETTGFGTTGLLYYRVQSGRRIEFIVSSTDIDGYDYDNGDAIDLDLLEGLVNQQPVKTYSKKYLNIRFADSVTPTTMHVDPVGHTFWGIYESDSLVGETDPSLYRWTRAKTEEGLDVTFQTYGYKFYFWTRGGRAIAFQVTNVSPDNTIWGDIAVNVIDHLNPYINLDVRSGLVVTRGSTPSGLNQVPTYTDPITGVVTYAMLQTLPNPLDFDITTISRIATDQYGRVISLGFLDQFFAASEYFTAATDNQVISFTHIASQGIYFRNGILVDSTEFTETSSTVTITGLKATDKVGAFRFRMLDGNTAAPIVPFSLNTYTLTSGQSTIPCTLSNNTELLFLNGIFLEDYAYVINTDGSITLDQPVSGSTKVSLYKFQVRNGLSPVFSQSITALDASTLVMSTSLDTRGLLTMANGLCLVEGTDYNISGTRGIALTFTPLIDTGLLETTSFVSYGSGEWNGVPKATNTDYTLSNDIAGPKQPDTLGTIINDLRSQIINLTTEVNNLKGNT